MRRLYVLLPTAQVAEAVVDDLLAAGVAREALHVVARSEAAPEDVPEEVDEGRPGGPVRRQAAVGGAVGLLAGLAGVALPGGVVAVGATLAGMGAAGTGVGAVIGALLGRSEEDPEVRSFEDAVERGEVLLLADVARDRLEEIEALIQRRHPEARIAGTDPSGTFPRSGPPR